MLIAAPLGCTVGVAVGSPGPLVGVLFDLIGLSFPVENNADAPWDDAEIYDGPQLFVQTARRVRHDFVPTDDERAAIVALCQMVGGLPLAIELAAGWIRHFTCHEIAEQVRDDLGFLQSTTYNLPERHRDLRGMLRHAWALLSPREQRIARSLAVLRGPWSREVATQIAPECRASHLVRLADQSIISRTRDGNYQWHALIREIAAEELADHPAEAALAGQRHSAALLGRLADAEAALLGPDQRATLAQLQAMFPDLRAAWLAAVAAHTVPLLHAALASLSLLLSRSGWFHSGVELFDLSLAELAVLPETQHLRARVVIARASLMVQLGPSDAERARLETAAADLLARNEPAAEAERLQAEYHLGVIAVLRGEYQRANEHAAQALALSERLAVPQLSAMVHNLIGNLAQKQGDYPRAQAEFETALRLHPSEHDLWQAAMIWNNLGNIAQARAEYEAAQAHYQQAYSAFETIGFANGMAVTLTNLGYVAWRRGDFYAANELQLASLVMKRRLQQPRGIVISLINLAEIATSLAEVERALALFREALLLAQTHAMQPLILEVFVGIAELFWHLGEAAAALPLLDQLAHHTAAPQEARERAIALRTRQHLPAATSSASVPDLAEITAHTLRQIDRLADRPPTAIAARRG